MCDIVGLLGIAISAAQGIMAYQGQQAAYEQQERMYEANRQNALMAFRAQQEATNIRQIQEQETASQERFDTALEARAARATARTAAGESGVSGFSIEHLLRDMYSREARFNDRVDTNLDWTMQQLQLEKKQQAYRALDRINAVPRGQKPNFADAALRIGAGAVNAMAGWQQRNPGQTMQFPRFA